MGRIEPPEGGRDAEHARAIGERQDADGGRDGTARPRAARCRRGGESGRTPDGVGADAGDEVAHAIEVGRPGPLGQEGVGQTRHDIRQGLGPTIRHPGAVPVQAKGEAAVGAGVAADVGRHVAERQRAAVADRDAELRRQVGEAGLGGQPRFQRRDGGPDVEGARGVEPHEGRDEHVAPRFGAGIGVEQAARVELDREGRKPVFRDAADLQVGPGRQVEQAVAVTGRRSRDGAGLQQGEAGTARLHPHDQPVAARHGAERAGAPANAEGGGGHAALLRPARMAAVELRRECQ